MSPFIISALSGTGVAEFTTSSATAHAFGGPQAYINDMICGSLDAVNSADPYVNNARYTPTGRLRLYDATAGLPAQYFHCDGLAFTSSGQLCITTDAPSSPFYISGLAVRSDGAVYAQVS